MLSAPFPRCIFVSLSELKNGVKMEEAVVNG